MTNALAYNVAAKRFLANASGLFFSLWGGLIYLERFRKKKNVLKRHYDEFSPIRHAYALLFLLVLALLQCRIWASLLSKVLQCMPKLFQL
jgi:hypothetical protein